MKWPTTLLYSLGFVGLVAGSAYAYYRYDHYVEIRDKQQALVEDCTAKYTKELNAYSPISFKNVKPRSVASSQIVVTGTVSYVDKDHKVVVVPLDCSYFVSNCCD